MLYSVSQIKINYQLAREKIPPSNSIFLWKDDKSFTYVVCYFHCKENTDIKYYPGLTDPL